MTEPYVKQHWLSNAAINLAGNVVAFVPLGIFLPCLREKLRRFGKLLSCVIVFIISVELIQLLTLRGCCDIDDLILKVLGAIIGLAALKLVEKKTCIEWRRLRFGTAYFG